MIVPRTCTEISAGNEDQHREKESRLGLSKRSGMCQPMCCSAILGQARRLRLRSSARRLGRNACLRYIPPTEFLTFDPQSPSRMARQDTLYRRT